MLWSRFEPRRFNPSTHPFHLAVSKSRAFILRISLQAIATDLLAGAIERGEVTFHIVGEDQSLGFFRQLGVADRAFG